MRGLILMLLIVVNLATKAADFNRFFPHLIKSEGVFFVMIQYDRGGATKYGITLNVYRMYCNQTVMFVLMCDKDKNGILNANDLRLTRLGDVYPIYYNRYWAHWRLSEIRNQAIADIISDMLVNSGPGRGLIHLKTIQHFIGIKKPDGIIGSQTINLINKSDSQKLYNMIFQYRYNYYKRIGVGKQRKFLKGWINRINNLKRIHENENLIIRR